MLQKGQIVELDGLLAVVVALAGEQGVPDDHVAVWFGDPMTVRKSQGGPGGAHPELWIVPEEYCEQAAEPVFLH